MLTFGQFKQSGAIDIAGVCEDSTKFMEYTNSATRRLMNRGDWSDTAQIAYFCVYSGCIVLPRYIDSIRKLNICRHAIPVHNEWYQFMSSSHDNCGWWGWRGPSLGLNQEGTACTIKPVQGDGRLVRAYARCNTDFGQTVQIFGTDNNGQPLQTDNGDGTFSMGLTLVLQAPFASTSVFVRDISYVIKSVTQCPVDLYAYNASANLLETLAHYDPSETVPSYSRIKLSMPVSPFTPPTTGCCSGLIGVLAMVKLRFIPVQNDYDLILIPNQDALELEIQAIKAQRAGDFTNYKALEAAAIAELNNQLRNDVPEDQFAASDDTLGPHVWGNACF